MCTETLYDVQWLAQLALLVVVRVAVNPHPKRLWVHGPKLIHDVASCLALITT